MNISIFGLGHVGCVGAACCASLGHHVIGNDCSEDRVNRIRAGRPTVFEAGLDVLCAQAHDRGLLEATMDSRYAVHHSEISFIAVGTPGGAEGRLNLDSVFAAAKQIGRALADKEKFHIVAIRSTVPPGTCQKAAGMIAGVSGKEYGKDFTVVSNPEFLREGTAVEDYLNPALTLIGTDSACAEAKFRELYQGFPGKFISTETAAAEIVKYLSNTWHGLKIGFSNEAGNLCRKLGIDSHRVMEIFCEDKRLNISPAYLKPGFAYGGSCLPKDIRALRALARDLQVDVSLINAIDVSNEKQKQNAIEIILSKGKRKIGILGLSFKPGTDDLRGSPILDVAEELLRKGCEIQIYDKTVCASLQHGLYADRIPHLREYITDDLDAVCSACGVLVIANREDEFAGIPARYPHKILVDLVRQFTELAYDGEYEGISWGNINRGPARNQKSETDGENRSADSPRSFPDHGEREPKCGTEKEKS